MFESFFSLVSCGSVSLYAWNTTVTHVLPVIDAMAEFYVYALNIAEANREAEAKGCGGVYWFRLSARPFSEEGVQTF